MQQASAMTQISTKFMYGSHHLFGFSVQTSPYPNLASQKKKKKSYFTQYFMELGFQQDLASWACLYPFTSCHSSTSLVHGVLPGITALSLLLWPEANKAAPLKFSLGVLRSYSQEILYPKSSFLSFIFPPRLLTLTHTSQETLKHHGITILMFVFKHTEAKETYVWQERVVLLEPKLLTTVP